MGTQKDTKRRSNLRQDTMERRALIEKMRGHIFKGGISVANPAINRKLTSQGSLVPSRNAFSSTPDDNYNFYTLFVPDLLHEFELGVWKATFTHLMRILLAQGGSSVTDLNQRYRTVPAFGATIRRFSNNASSMKKIAARDFEDLLQCALPVFEGILPKPHDNNVLNLLFALGSWHAYAKLRLHTETTLNLLEAATVKLGREMRHFKKTTCAAYITKELPREIATRGRKKAAMALKGKTPVENKKGQSKLIKTLNLNTYKFHALSKYVDAIRRYGTSDSYSTQIVSRTENLD